MSDDDDDDTLMMRGRVEDQLPRFDISVTGLRAVRYDDAPSVDTFEIEEESTIREAKKLEEQVVGVLESSDILPSPEPPAPAGPAASKPTPRRSFAPVAPTAVEIREMVVPGVSVPYVPSAATPSPAPIATSTAPANDEAPRRPGTGSFFTRTARLPSTAPDAMPSPSLSGSRGPLLGTRVSRTALLLAALSAAVTIALVVWLLRPSRGELHIAAVGPHGPVLRADVFVDNEKKCDTSPCVVPDLVPGPRNVQVIAPGFAPISVTENVESGKQRLALVSLAIGAATPSASSAPSERPATSPAATEGKSELLVASSAPSARLLLDGADKGALPLHLRDLSPGSHRVRVVAGDAYEPLERVIDLSAGRAVDLGSVALRLLKAKVIVELSDAGARVVLQREDGTDQALRGPFPATLDLDARRSYRIVAKKAGFSDFEVDLKFDDGNAERHVKVELEKKGSGPARTPRPEPRERAPKAEEKPEKQAAAPSGGMGTININSLPASRVLLDGVPVGNTPKVELPVSAGVHTVTFVHPDLGKKTVSVTVKAGQNAVAAVRFKAPDP